MILKLVDTLAHINIVHYDSVSGLSCLLLGACRKVLLDVILMLEEDKLVLKALSDRKMCISSKMWSTLRNL